MIKTHKNTIIICASVGTVTQPRVTVKQVLKTRRLNGAAVTSCHSVGAILERSNGKNEEMQHSVKKVSCSNQARSDRGASNDSAAGPH